MKSSKESQFSAAVSNSKKSESTSYHSYKQFKISVLPVLAGRRSFHHYCSLQQFQFFLGPQIFCFKCWGFVCAFWGFWLPLWKVVFPEGSGQNIFALDFEGFIYQIHGLLLIIYICTQTMSSSKHRAPTSNLCAMIELPGPQHRKPSAGSPKPSTQNPTISKPLDPKPLNPITLDPRNSKH